MEDLISNAAVIFEDLHGKRPPPISVKSITPPSTTQSLEESALPVPPSESPSSVDYGSVFTKIVTLPPRPSREQDFTPTLPTRPTPSIHPSRRAGTTQSVKSEASSAPRSPITPSVKDEPEDMSLPTSSALGDSPLSAEFATAANTPATELTEASLHHTPSTSDSTDSAASTVVPEDRK